MKLKKLLFEGDIKYDIKNFIEELKSNKIIDHGKYSSTGSGARGKYKVWVSTGGKSSTDIRKKLEKYYKVVGQSQMSGPVYYSSKNKLYFYFYSDKDRSYSSELDEFIIYDYVFLVRRKNTK